LKILHSSEVTGQDGLRTELVGYSLQKKDGRIAYSERAFIATGDLCGDMEFYADAPFSDDAGIKQIFSTFKLDQSYTPRFHDVFAYGEILYKRHAYAAAAPMFELASKKLQAHPEGDLKTMTRVLIDQAGMSYGMAGENAKARTLFEKGIAGDPDYPLYYYNLACADAADKDLSAAHDNLQKAFARKGNVLTGETMPDPTKDDSFLPYQSNKKFWTFVETLTSKR
jgi:tetratricopeptide (TPR) repeat protein